MDSASRTGRRASRRSRTTWACRPARWALPCWASRWARWSPCRWRARCWSASAAAGIVPRVHLLAVAALLLAGGLYATRRLLPGGADRDQATPRFVRPTRTLALLGAIAFCGLLSEGAAYDWSSVYLRDSLGASEGLAVSAYAAFTFTMTVGRLVGDRLRARYGSRALLGSAALVAAAGLGGGLALRHTVAAVIGFAVLGAGLSCIVPIVFGAAGSAGGLPSGPAIAVVSTVGYLGFIA